MIPANNRNEMSKTQKNQETKTYRAIFIGDRIDAIELDFRSIDTRKVVIANKFNMAILSTLITSTIG